MNPAPAPKVKLWLGWAFAAFFAMTTLCLGLILIAERSHRHHQPIASQPPTEPLAKSSICGRWAPVGGSKRSSWNWDFFPDGSIVGGYEVFILTGTYHFVDADHIRVEWPSFNMVNRQNEDVTVPASASIYSVYLSNSDLTLTNSFGSTTKFERAD
jgi:hypothetical protein